MLSEKAYASGYFLIRRPDSENLRILTNAKWLNMFYPYFEVNHMYGLCYIQFKGIYVQFIFIPPDMSSYSVLSLVIW